MSAWTQLTEPGPALLILVLAASSQIVTSAPLDDLEQQSSDIEYYPVADATGCYYNFEHYDEGDRIITNEPCLNCTCHNRMLMCYLRVCPFTKAIGQDCKVEKKSDQCCPVITCPEVPVHLLPSASTTPSTAVGHLNEYGCSIDNLFYADGAKVPSNPNNPCEVCYCIRNKTACIIQECTLTGKVVEGCLPVYVDGVCCPVRYDCDHPELETTPRPLLTTTTLPPTSAPTDCIYHNEVYADGALVKKDVPCEQCYCMRGDIVCAVQECGPTPLDKVNCTALPAKEGQCCPDTYECENISEKDLTTLTYYEAPTTQPTEVASSESSITSDIEEPTATDQEEEQPSTETEGQVTESQSTEDINAAQPVTESATVESFTSRITDAVDAITARVTEIVEAFTSAVSKSDQETTVQPEIQTTEPETPLATETPQTVDQQATTVSEVEEGTQPEIVVTEKASQETVPIESEGPKTTVAESATEQFEIPAHDDHEDEFLHEDQETDVEGSGKPIEEQPVPSATSTPETEDRHTRPVDQLDVDQATTQRIEGELITTEQTKPEVTEEGSGAEEDHTLFAEIQPTTQTSVEITEHEDESSQTTVSIESESHVKVTEPAQTITDESPIATTETIPEKQGATYEPPVTDAEAQETIQPLEPERSTEQTKQETPAVPEIETTISEEEQPHHDITQEPEVVTEEITARPEDKLNELVPSVEESQTTVKPEEEEAIPSITEESIIETEQKETTPAEGAEQDKLDITTEKEQIDVITEIPIKETEKPESMDHVSETGSVTPLEQVTEKPEKSTEITETEQPISATQSSTDQPGTYTKTPELESSTSVPVSPEICGDKGCKATQGENEIPAVEEICTKESCKPQEQLPSSETSTDKTVPIVCDSEHGCAPSPAEEVTKIPGEPSTGKETEDQATDKITDAQPPCDVNSGCVPGETDKEIPEVIPTETSDKFPTEGLADETATQSATEPSDVGKTEQPEEVEGSGGETTDFIERGTTPEYGTTSAGLIPTVKPEDQTVSSEKEPELETTEQEVAYPTTIRTYLEHDTETTTASERITPLPQEPTSEGTISETPKEDKTETPQETDLSVSPISPESTEVPETITITTETQKIEVPSSTELLEGGKDIQTESIVQETTEIGVEATPSVEIAHEPETVSPEVVPVTEIGISQNTESDTTQSIGQEQEATPALDVEEGETTESVTKPSQDKERAETTAPTITRVPEITDQVSVDTETAEAVTESETPEGPKISGTTSSYGIAEEQTSTAVESQDTEAPLSEDTQGPEEIPAVSITTEQSRIETPGQILPQESESPQVTTTNIPSEVAGSTEQVSSEKTPEVSQGVTETEVPISATESDSEVTTEIVEEHGIPGEGSCLVDGQTYKNNSLVPPINQCQTSCKCLSSILQCESVPCTPPPSNLQCAPIFHSADACCPVYSCSVPGVTSMESDSHVMETTTVGELVTGTRVIPSEEIVTERLTTVKSEVPSEAEVTEQLPVKPTEEPVAGEITEPSDTQKEIVGETEGTSEPLVPESQTVSSDQQTTTTATGGFTKPSEEQVPSQDDIENEIIEEPIQPDHCGIDGCAPAEPTQLPQEEIVTSLPGVSKLETEAPIEPQVTDEIVTEEEQKIPDTTVSSVTEQVQEVPEQTEGVKTDKEGALPDTTEGPSEEEEKVSVTTQPQEEIPEQTEGEKGGSLPATTESVVPERPEGEPEVSTTAVPEEEIPEQTEGQKDITTESVIPERPIEGETETLVTVQPQEEIPEQTESTKVSDKESAAPDTTEGLVPETPTEKESEQITDRPQEIPEQTESEKDDTQSEPTEAGGLVEPITGETEISITEHPQEIPEQTEGETEGAVPGTTEGALPQKEVEEETEVSVTVQPQEAIPEQTEEGKEDIVPGTTERVVPERPTKEDTETLITEQPQEETPEQTESEKEGALPGTTESVIPERPFEGETESSVTVQPDEEIPEQTESLKEGALPGATESTVPEGPIKEDADTTITEQPEEEGIVTQLPIKDETETAITEQPMQEISGQTEVEKVGTTESAIPERPIEGETEIPVTIQPDEEIPEQTESVEGGALPGATETVPEGPTKEGTEATITEQPEAEISEETEIGKEGALPGTTESVVPEKPNEGEIESLVTVEPEEEITEQTEGEKALPGTTESVIPEKPVDTETEISVTIRPQEEVPEQTETEKEGNVPDVTETVATEKPIEGEADVSVTVQPQEIPAQTEGTRESNVPEVTESGITEKSIEEETEVSVTVQPQEEVPEQTEGKQEDAVPGTTESVLPERPVEGETDASIIEQDEVNTEDITVHSLITETPEIVTEISSEESSKTPEEIAAAPEMEEAVTTPSVLTATQSISIETSSKASEQTTLRIGDESEITTEKKPEHVETEQTTVSLEAELTPRPQYEDSSVPTEGESTEKAETLPPTVATDIETEEGSGTEVPEFESITETHIADTTSSLETEAQVTVKVDTESEKPQDFTEVPATEISPESTSKQVLEEATPEISQTESASEEVVTQEIPTVEQQPGKPIESEEPVTEKLATPESEITEPTTVKFEEPVDGVTIPDQKSETTATESTEQEIGEFPTHAQAANVTDIPAVTEDKDTPVTVEGEQPGRATDGLVTSQPTEESVTQKSESVPSTEREEPTFTLPQIITEGPLNMSGLYTSGPQVELSTKKYVKGELSTSVPVTTQPSTSVPTFAPAPAPGHEIPGEHVPELPDYHSPVEDYEDEDQSPLGPGTCRYGGKVYVSAQQIPRDDPCDFCFCFRSDIICLQQSCPPPIPRCHEEPIRGFCCPRYECPVGMATAVNVTTSTTTTTTTLPPHFLSHPYKGRVTKSGCQIKGRAYQVGDVIPSASGPCLQCTCGGDGEMKCDPKACSPEPMLRQMIAAAVSRRRR